ncbi:MAG: protoheme IX farnesyltransferase [Alphaproteobacteria bacterium]|nr:protoheme IX farnesyltransferase [Alphaproteobacteria bacterium]
MAIGWAGLASILKLRIGFAIALTALAGVAVASGPAPEAWRIGLLALAVLAASGAAGAFNQYAERDLDARMLRTRDRPFASGKLAAGPIWPWAIGILGAAGIALAAWAAGWVAAGYVFLGAFVYGVVYTVWLKRRTALNIVVGGLAGSFALLAGAAAVDPAPQAVPMILAVVLFLWTPPHFWSLAFALKDDYARAGVPMLPVVMPAGRAAWIILGHSVVLALLALLPAAYGLGPIYLAAAALGGGWFVWQSIRLVARPDAARAMANFRASLVQLVLLLTGAMLDGQAIGTARAESAKEMRALMFNDRAALAYSQKAIGRALEPHALLDRKGEARDLGEYRGRPLVVGLIYTSCSHVCPLIVQHLRQAETMARPAVGRESFQVAIVGIDSSADTPQRMALYARSQGLDKPGWEFFSADEATIERLAANLGFLYAPVAGGFDHLSQVSVIDANGRVYRQVYGENFAPQALVEPLKDLIYGGSPDYTTLSGLAKRVRLICTVYDPNQGGYRFSYGIFFGLVIGAMTVLGSFVLLVRVWLRQMRPRGAIR